MTYLRVSFAIDYCFDEFSSIAFVRQLERTVYYALVYNAFHSL